MIVIPLAGNGVTAQEAPKQEQVTGAEMTSNNNNNIVAWAKDTGKRLRLSTYDMAGEEGWRPLVYADNYSGDAVFHDDKRIPGVMADARLISAAPDLLDACKAALSDDQPYIKKCRAALAKTTGEQT